MYVCMYILSVCVCVTAFKCIVCLSCGFLRVEIHAQFKRVYDQVVVYFDLFHCTVVHYHNSTIVQICKIYI